MKLLQLVIIITWVLPIGMLVSCNEDEEKTIDFEASFYTTRGDPLTMCEVISENNFWAKEHQVGEGTATLLGDFTTEMRFCIHIILDEAGNPDPTAEGFGVYHGTEGEIINADGDQLIVEVPEGLVKPTTKEGYVFEFQDKVFVTGGTGVLEGATGELITNSYVSFEGVTDHVWSGKITLPK